MAAPRLAFNVDFDFAIGVFKYLTLSVKYQEPFTNGMYCPSGHVGFSQPQPLPQPFRTTPLKLTLFVPDSQDSLKLPDTIPVERENESVSPCGLSFATTFSDDDITLTLAIGFSPAENAPSATPTRLVRSTLKPSSFFW